MMVPSTKLGCASMDKVVAEANIIQLVGVPDIFLVIYFKYHPTYLIGLLW